MYRLGEVPAKPVEELAKNGSSPVLRFLGRLLTLIVAFFAWLFVLIGAAAVVLVHLMVVALARGTAAAVSAVVNAEADAQNDMTSSFARLRGRRGKAETRYAGPHGSAPADSSRRLPSGDQRRDVAGAVASDRGR